MRNPETQKRQKVYRKKQESIDTYASPCYNQVKA